jgi:hypothetical protein
VGELPESVIADLRAARVPWVEGMLVGWLDAPAMFLTRLVGDGEDASWRRADGTWIELVGNGECGDWMKELVPDPRDRATFLLLLDELARRLNAGGSVGGYCWKRTGRGWSLYGDGGETGVWLLALGALRYGGPHVRTIDGIDVDDPVAALARALRESAPGEVSRG